VNRTGHRSGATGVAAIAGGIGALVACCVVEVLIAAGVLAGLGGAVKGGIAAVAGLAVAVAAGLAAMILRRRRAGSAEDCCPPAGGTDTSEPKLHAVTGRR